MYNLRTKTNKFTNKNLNYKQNIEQINIYTYAKI